MICKVTPKYWMKMELNEARLPYFGVIGDASPTKFLVSSAFSVKITENAKLNRPTQI